MRAALRAAGEQAHCPSPDRQNLPQFLIAEIAAWRICAPSSRSANRPSSLARLFLAQKEMKSTPSPMARDESGAP